MGTKELRKQIRRPPHQKGAPMVGREDPWTINLPEPLQVLTPQQICQIDRFLAEIEAFGRVTLIKLNGRLRFIEKTESVEAIYHKMAPPRRK